MALASGTQLGPYEIIERLGAGGMGEVYRARDPRLSREVAVKLISTDGATSPDRLRRFETEARAAAQLAHPNVVTVFDVGTHEGQPYIVLELLEGETLRETLHGGVPPLRQAVAWALEISRGLAAAHERDIVHRDLKPENVFLTGDGRVKVLDFGLAKLKEPLVSDEADRESPTATKDTAPGVLLGTVGYMSPEQVKGQTPDARTDVFALGAVLYEMVSGRRAFSGDTAPEVLAAILRDEPPALESLQHGVPAAVETVVRRCLAKRPSDRFSSARAVEAALETALSTLEPSRVSASRAVESRGPYPGLSAFTEADAERFFGREGEVEALWEKLRRDRLLAVIGPSGAGKSSFVRAGLVPARPSGWGAIVATPGGAPMRALAQALVEELPSDADTMKQLLGFDDPVVAFSMVKKWRETHLEAVLVLDQFEELFTLCPPEAQERFAGLLGRLAREADVHVLVSMRDDFLMRCHEQEALVEVFEHLTPLGPLSEEGTRRALEEPAKREGFSFEDESLVAEMLESVEGARSALPLLAFAVARLWEKRDREKKLLTREAYEQIGGVAGALAQHAEQTLERIGTQREPIVRELFRNLVTAQWTRAVADREQLLSALPDPEVGAQVLDSLVDARLLTSYEVRDSTASSRGAPSGTGDEGSAAPSEPTQRHLIEIVHESLLRAWPRLVRWQAQDEEGAVLRDQLKQAANLWEEKGRPDDLLWTGTSEREFELWHDRYPGKLTALEKEYSRAMVDRSRRGRRIRRGAVAAAIVVLAAVAGAITVSRQQAAAARDEARAEALRAEASKLLALAQVRLTDDPTEALAFTTASLELADTHEARVFAMRALWSAPPAFEIAAEGYPRHPGFSPHGKQLAVAGHQDGVGVWVDTGERIATLTGHQFSPKGTNVAAWATETLLVTGLCCRLADRLHVWDMPDGRRLRTIDLGGPASWTTTSERLLAQVFLEEEGGSYELRSWTLPDGEAEALGRVDPDIGRWPSYFSPDGRAWLYAQGRSVYLRPLPSDGGGDRLLDRHDADVLLGWPVGDRAFWYDESGEFRMWSFPSEGPELVERFARPKTPSEWVFPEPSGRWLVNDVAADAMALLWDRGGWPAARPLTLRRTTSWKLAVGAFHPTGNWFVVSTAFDHLTFWPLRQPHPVIVDGYTPFRRPLTFSPDSQWLATSWSDLQLRLWPISEKMKEGPSLLELPERKVATDLAMAPDGRFVFVAGDAPPYLVPLDGSPARALEGFPNDTALWTAAVSPSGQRVASAFGLGPGENEKTLRVWDLDADTQMVFDLPETGPVQVGDSDSAPSGTAVSSAAFAGESTLYTAGDGGVRRWDLESGTQELVLLPRPGHSITGMRLDAEGRTGLLHQRPHSASEVCLPVELLDIQAGSVSERPEFGECVYEWALALDPSGTVGATGGVDGLVRVGRLDGGEPHILAGHSATVERVAISPDLRWVASSGEDDTLRLWPMPDLDELPLHTLPREELLAKLKSLTNLRAVRDPDSLNGWTIELGPFPGWEDAPTW